MDNRYTAPELFILLREKYQILACGAIWSNRKRWDCSIMNLSKKTERGSSLVKYDTVNRILFGQWNENKVVSFISTLGISGSAQTVNLPIEVSLKRYTDDNFMGGVDNVDKDKKIGGAFTKKSMFKKWYRMGVLGVFDFMIVNGCVAWNMASQNNNAGLRRFALLNWKFRLILSEQMIAFHDKHSVNIAREEELALKEYFIPRCLSVTQNCCISELITNKRNCPTKNIGLVDEFPNMGNGIYPVLKRNTNFDFHPSIKIFMVPSP